MHEVGHGPGLNMPQAYNQWGSSQWGWNPSAAPGFEILGSILYCPCH